MNETGSLTNFTQTKAKLHFLINPYKKIHIKIIEEMKAKVHRRIKPSTNCYSKHLDCRYQPGAFLLEQFLILQGFTKIKRHNILIADSTYYSLLGNFAQTFNKL
jgi:hypothetical protein